MKQKIKHLKNKIRNNAKVIENYFFMTSLQVFSSAFGILIYPYLIRFLGADAYGKYVFSLAIVSYFVGVVANGFQIPGLKHITEQKNDAVKKSKIVSAIFSAKFYLTILTGIVFICLINYAPNMQNNKLLFSLVYLQIIAELFNPLWYFQAVQRMKIVTYFQLFFRLLSLPFIFIFVKKPDDLALYALIASLSVVLPALLLVAYMIIFEKLRIRLVSIKKTYSYFREAFPIFVSSFLGTLKQESVTVFIGLYFGMKEVALYDLANKIIILPRMLLNNINLAIFPKMTENLSVENIKKTLRYEWFIGLAMMIAVAAFGYPAIWLLGGSQMLAAYPLAVILSFTVVVWLVVGSYIYFIFVPNGQNYYITMNQLVALIAFIVCIFPAFYFFNNILAVVIALSFSGLAEVLFCHFLIKKRAWL